MSLPKLSEKLFECLERELVKGPIAHGGAAPRAWVPPRVLSRIKTLIGCRFHKTMTLSAIEQSTLRRGLCDNHSSSECEDDPSTASGHELR
ncbi:hypothetical protein ACIHJG_07170 [Streptomyces sp. NPDC052415]|uniref:hypothetical protein n=1 Tax=Streptomyces sp. NPDC052415 TaxID=3365690 RepID=UPI0037D2BBC6